MLRRNVRLRKEYLYRKGLEGKEKAEYERKRAMKKALEGGATSRAHGAGGTRAWRPMHACPLESSGFTRARHAWAAGLYH